MRREQPNHKQKKTTNKEKPCLWAKRDSSFLGVTALVGNPAKSRRQLKQKTNTPRTGTINTKPQTKNNHKPQTK